MNFISPLFLASVSLFSFLGTTIDAPLQPTTAIPQWRANRVATAPTELPRAPEPHAAERHGALPRGQPAHCASAQCQSAHDPAATTEHEFACAATGRLSTAHRWILFFLSVVLYDKVLIDRILVPGGVSEWGSYFGVAAFCLWIVSMYSIWVNDMCNLQWDIDQYLVNLLCVISPLEV